MRFLPDGPEIPESLIESQERGEVVFVCGAGVSMNSGMPSFLQLARDVSSMLGMRAESRAGEMLTLCIEAEREGKVGHPLDEVFSAIESQYGREAVEEKVHRRLSRTRKGATLREHSTILQLSRDSENRARVVTTNFDRLFERAERKLKKWEPPLASHLPASGHFHGLVHLHGRLPARRGGYPAGLVLTAADFGTAYLTDGWAARFVEQLIARFTVVLVGYKAEDPPVKYLLRGLHAARGADEGAIVAFDCGAEGEVRDRWRDRGIVGIAYEETEDHASLWDSLAEWAERCRDPEGWKHRIISLANRAPSELGHFERGQVLSLIRTSSGARAFADFSPSPNSEWIYVFDSNVRVPFSQDDCWASDETLRTDRDPKGAIGRNPQQQRPETEDAFTILESEVDGSSPKRIVGWQASGPGPIPNRAIHMLRWVADVAERAPVLWWLAGLSDVHPTLIDLVERRLEGSAAAIDTDARDHLRLLIERIKHSGRGENYDRDLFRLRRRIASDGWTTGVLREIRRVLEPFIVVSRPFGEGLPTDSDPPPAMSEWSFARLEVVFPKPESLGEEFPDDVLGSVVSMAFDSLSNARLLLAGIGVSYYSTFTLHLEGGRGSTHPDSSSRFQLWAVKLLQRLVELDPERATGEVARWPNDDRFFFDKLRVFAWGLPGLFAAEESLERIASLPSDVFWAGNHRREMLIALSQRWSGGSTGIRRTLEERIRSGPPSIAALPDDREEAWRQQDIAGFLGWLQDHSCDLGAESLAVVDEFAEAEPRRAEVARERAANSGDARSGAIETVGDPSAIETLPISEISEAAERLTLREIGEFRQFQPFRGLVKERPRRAYRVLVWEASEGRYPIDQWQVLLQDLPPDSGSRLLGAILSHSCSLPDDEFAELCRSICVLAERRVPTIAEASLGRALELLDCIVARLEASVPESMSSSVISTSTGGEPAARSRWTTDHAINAPTGILAQALIQITTQRSPREGEGLPCGIRERFDRLLDLPGEGGLYPLVVLTRFAAWLEALEPRWVPTRLGPCFRAGDEVEEAAWNGLLAGQDVPRTGLFKKIKNSFLVLEDRAGLWFRSSEASRGYYESAVVMTARHQISRGYITFAQLRDILQRGGDGSRETAASMWARLVDKNDSWSTFGKAFVRRAWPQELGFQSGRTSYQFASLAAKGGPHFSEIVSTTRQFLVPVEHPDMVVHEIMSSISDERISGAAPTVLELVHAIWGNRSPMIDRDLIDILEWIESEDESLSRDMRWIRLRRLLER